MIDVADSDDAISAGCLESLYEELFGSPILDVTATGEKSKRDKFDAYALTHEVAKEHPVTVRRAVRDAVSSHYRGDHPFDYSIGKEKLGRGGGDDL